MKSPKKNSYVRSQILNTLLKMLKTENLHTISITQLTNKAAVSRASFYRNYTSTEDVLQQEASRLNQILETTCKEDDPNDIRLKIIRLMDFYKLHSSFYLTLYHSKQTQLIQEFIVKKDIPSDLPAPIAYTLSAFSHLIYGWLIEWIKRGMNESSQEIIEMFERTTSVQ